MIACSNFNLNHIDVSKEEKEKHVEFGKLYFYNNNGIYIHISFSDNFLDNNDNDLFYIGDIILDEDLVNSTNEQIIEYYSTSYIIDVLLS